MIMYLPIEVYMNITYSIGLQKLQTFQTNILFSESRMGAEGFNAGGRSVFNMLLWLEHTINRDLTLFNPMYVILYGYSDQI